MASLTYHEQKDIENIKKLRGLIKELPPFCADFFRGIEPLTSTRTRIAYAYDLRIFFDFLKTSNSQVARMGENIPLSVLEQLTVTDLEEYMEYLKCHPSVNNEDVYNTERGIMRKVSSLKSFYNYFYRNERIEKNPASLLRLPKLHEKEITRLEIDEVARLLDEVEEGEKLTERQKLYHERTKVRDLAMLTLLLGTGLRVSECVGLNINDVDLDACGVRIFRKGGKESIVYFSDEVRDVLETYLDERQAIDALPSHEDAVFLSLQKKRMSVRTVENMVARMGENIPLSVLEQLTVTDLEEYMEYLKCHPSVNNEDVYNTERGIMRKVSSLKSFYNYFYRNERIEKNPASLLRLPKLHEKEITRLEIDEVARLLDEVEEGEKLTERQKLYHERTKVRDLAMLTLLLGTGLRVSECVGLNINDVDLDACGVRIFRKGGKESIVYFSDEVRDVLETYLDERQAIDALPSHEDAVFLSLQKKRMSVRTVENMVKKYAGLVTPLKKITPHKLRSTYGTSLYRETGDIYLVASVLGHSDVNTTRKHYAAQEDQRRKSARNIVQLREKKEQGPQ